MKKKSTKLRRETLDNFRDLLTNISKRVGDMQAFDWAASIGERYHRQDIRTHVHMVGNLSEYCAIFEYHSMPRPKDERDFIAIIPRAGNGRPTCPPAPDNLYEPMLIRIIDLFEPNEGVVKTATPSLVWLQPLNECLMFISKTLNHLAPVTPSFDEFAFAASWKFKLIGQSFVEGNGCSPNQKDWELGKACNCVGFQQRQLMHQSIEGRTEIVGDLAYADTPIKGWSETIYADAIAAVSSLRIQIRPENTVIGSQHEGVANQSESLDFTFCTPYLEARAIQRMHELYYPYERKDSEDPKGTRDTRAHKGRVREELGQGGEACEGFTDSPPEEGLTQTSPSHRPGGYTARHTHSGNPEDA